jgi:hypothetical protein
MDPARTFKESLTSRPELENSQGHERRSPQPSYNVRSRADNGHGGASFVFSSAPEGDIGLSRQQSTSKWAGPAVVNRTLEAHDDCDSHASRAPNDWFHTTSLRGQLYPGDTSL